MTWVLELYPSLLFVTTFIAVIVAVYVSRRFNAPGVKPFTWLMLAIAERSLMGAFELIVADPNLKIFFASLSYIGITAVPPIWILFVLEYIQEEAWFNQHTRRVLWLVPVITVLVAFTNSYHNLLWHDITLVATEAGTTYLHFDYGPWFWVYGIYSYALTLAGILLLGAAVMQFSPVYRRQGILLFIGTLFPFATNFLYVTGFTKGVDLTPLVIVFSAGMFSLGFIRFHVFAVRPMARGNLMSNINDGIMILDANNHIADINPSAIEIFELSADVMGKHVAAVFGKWAELLQRYSNTLQTQDEIKITTATGKELYLDIKITSLTYKEHFTGRVILLRDITERKRSENALRDTQALYHTLVENLTVAIFRKSIDGRYTFVNQAFTEIIGLDAERVIGKTDSELFDAHLAWLYYQSDQKVIKENKRIETEEEAALENKGKRLVHVVKTPILDSEGRITGIQGMFWDMTEMKLKEEQLRQNAEQLATLNRTMQALSSTLDLTGVLETILSELQKVVPYDSSSIFEVKGEYLEMVSGRGFPNLGELLGLRFSIDDTGSPSSVVMRTRAPYILEDAPRQYAGFKEKPHTPARIHGWMGVPLIFGNDVLGMLALDKHETNYYNERHAQVALAFATQAAIAVQNARLFTRVNNSLKNERIRAERQSTLVRLSELLAALHNEEEIWQQSADGIYNPGLGYYSITMFAWDSQSGDKIVRGRVGKDARNDWEVLPSGQGLSERALLAGRIIYTPNVNLAAEYVPGIGEGCEADVPIWIGEDIAGVMSIESNVIDGFGPEDLEIFAAAANQIGLALSKARLLQEQKIKLEEIRSLEAQLREQAMRDALTGLYNRRYLNDSLSRELAHVQREGIPLSVIMLDIDLFKKINDTYGHKMGDIVLINLSDTIKRHVRGGDIPCRFGGEEFVIMLPGASTEIATRRAEAFRAMFEKQVITSGELTIKATISLGVATFPAHGHNIEEVLNKADQALYAAKQAGRNQVKVSGSP